MVSFGTILYMRRNAYIQISECLICVQKKDHIAKTDPFPLNFTAIAGSSENGGLDPSSPLPDLVQHQPSFPGSKVSEMPSGTLLLLHGRVMISNCCYVFKMCQMFIFSITSKFFFVFHSGSLNKVFFGYIFSRTKRCHLCHRLAPLPVKVSTHWCNVVLTWMVDGSTEFMVDAHAWRSLERQRLGGFKRCRSTVGKAGLFFFHFSSGIVYEYTPILPELRFDKLPKKHLKEMGRTWRNYGERLWNIGCHN